MYTSPYTTGPNRLGMTAYLPVRHSAPPKTAQKSISNIHFGNQSKNPEKAEKRLDKMISLLEKNRLSVEREWRLDPTTKVHALNVVLLGGKAYTFRRPMPDDCPSKVPDIWELTGFNTDDNEKLLITFDHTDPRNRKFTVDYDFACNDLYAQFKVNAQKQALRQKKDPKDMTLAEKALHLMRLINAKIHC
jgi:hypothetical protein